VEWREGGDGEVFNGGEVWEGALIESGPLDAEIGSASKRGHSGYRRLFGRCWDGCRILFFNVFIYFLHSVLLVLTFTYHEKICYVHIEDTWN
jgi:hypothetical protein